jgi:integrase/recombinase XerD
MGGINMARRKAATSTRVLNTLVSKKEQESIESQTASKEFLRHCTIKGLSPDTVKFYDKVHKGLFRAFHESEVSLTDVNAMQTECVENWVKFMFKNNRAVSSINDRMRAGRTFFNFCLKKEYVEKNPSEGVHQLRKRHTIDATFTKEQLERLLGAPDITQFIGLRDLAIILTQKRCLLRI